VVGTRLVIVLAGYRLGMNAWSLVLGLCWWPGVPQAPGLVELRLDQHTAPAVRRERVNDLLSRPREPMCAGREGEARTAQVRSARSILIVGLFDENSRDRAPAQWLRCWGQLGSALFRRCGRPTATARRACSRATVPGTWRC